MKAVSACARKLPQFLGLSQTGPKACRFRADAVTLQPEFQTTDVMSGRRPAAMPVKTETAIVARSIGASGEKHRKNRSSRRVGYIDGTPTAVLQWLSHRKVGINLPGSLLATGQCTNYETGSAG